MAIQFTKLQDLTDSSVPYLMVMRQVSAAWLSEGKQHLVTLKLGHRLEDVLYTDDDEAACDIASVYCMGKHPDKLARVDHDKVSMALVRPAIDSDLEDWARTMKSSEALPL